MIDVKRFSGILNLDDGEEDVLPHQHIDAKNVRFIGGSNGLTAQNIKGNFLVNNSNLPAGTNECNGAFYDAVRRRILWFNWNSNGNHGLYQLLVQSGQVTQLFRCGVHSATDILRLSRNFPVHSAVIVYRSEGDGDLLYFTNGDVASSSRPRYFNLDTIATIGTFTEDMINAAKNAPLSPPLPFYRDDATVNANNLQKKLFRFIYRWVYKNGEKSSWSPISKEPLPFNDDLPNFQNDPTKNNNIRIPVIGGGSDYQKIEIAGQINLNNIWSDFFLIESLDRDDYSIAPGATYNYDFYNNGSYPNVSPEDTDLYYDYLPDYANTLELLNGNVLIYAGITDGEDQIQRADVDVIITATSVNPANTNGSYGPTWKWNAQYRFGIVYFDERGKTNGVVSFVGDPIDTTDFVVSTTDYTKVAGTNQVPRINASINHLAPSWAVSYQWVRTPNLGASSFLYYLTNDYQTDSNYLYLGLQSLLTKQAENTGFVPSYEFKTGDRVRIVGRYDLITGFEPYNIKLDLEILGTVQRTMTSPASEGMFLKVNKPSTFPSVAYQRNMLVEVYTPAVKANSDSQLFYEWGEKYNITGGFHMGQTQNQTALQPALFEWYDGDVYYRARSFYVSAAIFGGLNVNGLIIDAGYSDYFHSSVNSNGRGWVIDENAKTEYNSVLFRWGGAYQPGTNINALNRFRPNDFAEVDRSKGDVRRLKARDKILRFFQDRGVGQFGIYARFIQNNQGVPELVTTNEIITQDNAQYYQGQYGLCGYPTNLCSATIADYFNDVVTGREVRLSGDGITDLGMLYKGQFYLSSMVTPYNKELIRANESVAKVMKFWDSFESQAHTVLQAGSGGGVSGSDFNYSFNEPRNGFCSFYDFHPEWAISADDMLYTFKDGQIYKHDNQLYRCNFYGVQYGAHITVVFNKDLLQKKTWKTITQIASDTWECPSIYTNAASFGTTRQQTNLVTAEFQKLENNPAASIKRDANSRGGKINGSFLKGNYMVVKFQKQNAVNLIDLSELSVSYSDSALVPQ